MFLIKNHIYFVSDFYLNFFWIYLNNIFFNYNKISIFSIYDFLKNKNKILTFFKKINIFLSLNFNNNDFLFSHFYHVNIIFVLIHHFTFFNNLSLVILLSKIYFFNFKFVFIGNYISYQFFNLFNNNLVFIFFNRFFNLKKNNFFN